MSTSNLFKVLAAFAAGIVVALASIVIYIKVNAVEPTLPVADRTSSNVQTAAHSPVETRSIAAQEQPQPAASTEAEAPAPSHAEIAQPPRRVENVERDQPERKASATADRARASKPRIGTNTSRQTAAQAITPIPPPPPAVNDEAQLQTPLPDNAGAPQPPSTQPPYNAPPPPAQIQGQQVQRQPMSVTLQTGTNLVVRLQEPLSTDRNYTGDTFRATLDAPIVRDGYIIADRGSKVLGRIVEATKAGRIKGAAELQLALTQINTTDGQAVGVETMVFNQKGPSETRENAGKIAGGAAIGAIIGAIAGGGKGAAIGAGSGGALGTGVAMAGHKRPAVLPVETRLTFRLTAPVTITEKFN